MMVISCSELTKYYSGEKIPAIKKLNLDVAKGAVFGFLGPNGAGKTTTIKILTGQMSPDLGKVYILDSEMTVKSIDIKRKIGYIGQDHMMYSWMKSEELLLFVGSIFGLSKSDAKSRAKNLLDISGLSQAKNKRVSALSGGMKQRLGIAQAMMGKPEVLFLDEPTSALDPIGRKEVLNFIHEIKDETTVFMSTHILEDVERVCDTVAIIDNGEIIIQEETKNLKEKFSNNIIELEFANQNELETLKKIVNNRPDLGEIINESSEFLVIHPKDIDYSRKGFLDEISRNNIGLLRFELSKPSLEDIFVKLVEGKNE
ncbi:MAG: ABC transporter ATP-binding protein [Marinilabiliales bacterium]|nr:MAG: ABC transporter ATP-binding protein [Marinilabiliales bacterium]